MPFKVYSGVKFLRLADAFIIACRERNPLAGVYDAGALHWWWRDGAFDDRNNQRFWEGRDQTLGMLVLSERYATLGYQILPGLETRSEAQALLAEGLAWLERFELIDTPVKPAFFLRDPPAAILELVQQAGYEDTGSARIQRYQELVSLPTKPVAPVRHHVRPLADGDLAKGRPPLLDLSSADFEDVTGALYYDPDLHLVLESRDGVVAAECLCWWDEAFTTAMVEPIRVAKAYARQGLARDLMVALLALLARRGASVVKVSHDKHHYAAARLYHSLGFNPLSEQKLLEKRR